MPMIVLPNAKYFSKNILKERKRQIDVKKRNKPIVRKQYELSTFVSCQKHTERNNQEKIDSAIVLLYGVKFNGKTKKSEKFIKFLKIDWKVKIKWQIQ